MTDRIRSSQPPKGAQECSRRWRSPRRPEPVEENPHEPSSKAPKGAAGRVAAPRIAIAHSLRLPLPALFCGIIALFFCAFARADQPDANQNAALRYWPVMYRLSTDMAQGFVRLDEIEAKENPIEMEVATKFIERHQSAVATLAAISRLERCDWGLDPSQGEAPDLPHVRLMSQSQDFLLVDATLKLERADHAGAAASLATSLRMARHVRAGYSDISTSGMAVYWFTKAGARARQALANNIFDAADRAELRHALSRSLGKDPFGFGEMIALERKGRADDLNEWRTTGNKGRLAWMRFLEVFERSQTEDENEALRRLNVGSEDFAKQARMLDEAYAAVIAALRAPDVKAALLRAERSVEAGEYGLIALTVISRPSARYVAYDSAATLRDELLALIDQN